MHSKCSSLRQIIAVLYRDNRETPLPNVLSSPKLIKLADVNSIDCQAAFEGSDIPAALKGTETCDAQLPKSLCLSQFHVTSKRNRQAKVTFDIDSTCCFPSSLGVACLSINWFSRGYAILNLAADIHLRLKVSVYNKQGALT